MNRPHWSYPFYRLMWSGLDLLFPPRCGGCGKIGSRWCEECQKNVLLIIGNICEKCGQPQETRGICPSCLSNPPAFKIMRSWAAFGDPIRPALHKLKYRRDMALGDAIAVPLARFMESLSWPVNLIVPVPLGRKRFRERGYNQVAAVAKPFSLALNISYRPSALKRERETRSQVGLTAVERRQNVMDAFLPDERLVRGKTVLVMDDVSTTGSTLSSCAEALYKVGARDVYALTIARALSHHSLQQV